MPKVLGIKLGYRPNAGEAYIGWALLNVPGAPQSGVLDLDGADPAHAALSLARSKHLKTVELTTYPTAERFERSRPWLEGMTLDEHRLLIARTAALLRSDGITVIFKEAK